MFFADPVICKQIDRPNLIGQLNQELLINSWSNAK